MHISDPLPTMRKHNFQPAHTLAHEATASRQLIRLAFRAPNLALAPRGHGEPVILVPGYGGTSASMAPLQGYLHALGYNAHAWGLGRNRADFDVIVPGVTNLVELLAEKYRRRVHLIGWSLGGVVSRAAARRRPNLVAQIISYGSPILDRNSSPLQTPITAIYSRRDGVVGWRECIDFVSPRAENIEVRSAHFGMGIDPDVWRIVTQRLARTPIG